ncbi:MAG: ATP-binding protein [Methylacidiphilales bacterium]|nr:ATP-binding protein [Candidatus Methylacidiphilales bacterium]
MKVPPAILDLESRLLPDFSEKASGPAEILFRVGSDAQYLLVSANNQAQHLLGIPRTNLGDAPVRWEELPNNLVIYLTQAFEGLSRDENIALPIFETGQPENSSLAVKVQIHRHQEQNEWYYWFFLSFSDVSPWLGLQEEVMNARKLESIGALASGVAHDFNNLIMAIQGHAEFFLMTRKKDGELTDAMERIMKACANGASLTRSLLGYARKQSLVMEVIDLIDLVQDVVALARRSYGSRYVVELDELLERPKEARQERRLLINGCYSALSHCFLNVLNNSRDAMPNGGKIRVFSAVHGTTVTVAVMDEGAGIDPRDMPRIFEPFFTTKDVGAGTGLGLPMVQGIMKQHGGRVEIKSQKNIGTEFTFTWPLYQPESEHEMDLIQPEKSDGIPLPAVGNVPRLTYIIEDDENVMSSIESLMKLNSYESKSFYNPEAVLELLKQGELPGIIMVDYTMPSMDGLAFVRKAYEIMRENSKQPFLKIVLMSGFPPEHFSEFLKEFDGIPLYLLQKPFDSKSLINILRLSPRRFLRKITSRVNMLPALRQWRKA